MLLVMKTIDDKWYIVIKAYKFTVFEILSYIMCLPHAIPIHIESTNSTILNKHSQCLYAVLGCGEFFWCKL